MYSTLVQQILSLASSTSLLHILQQTRLTLPQFQELQQAIIPLQANAPAQALRLAQAIYETSREESPMHLAMGQWILGETLLSARQYLSANSYLHQSRHHYIELGQMQEAARVGVSCIATLAYTGQLSEALQLASQTEATFSHSAQTKRNNLRYLARLHLHVALVHELMGNPEQALALHERNLQNVISLGDVYLLARINMDRARILAQIHAFEEAITIYAQAEMLLHSLDNKVDLLKLYLDRNSLLIALGRFGEASTVQQLAQGLITEIEGMEHAAGWLNLLRVQLALATKEQPSLEAIEAVRQAQQIFAAQGPLIDECLAWLLLGRCQLNQHQWQEAQHSFEIVLAKSRLAGERTLEFRALHGLALLKQQRGETEEAILLLQLAIDKLEIARQGLQIETCRVAFLSDNLILYHDLAQFYLHQAQWEQAFEIIERAKSRLVGEKLASRLQTEVIDAIHSSDEHVRRLAQQLQSALQQLQQINQTIRLRQFADTVTPSPTDEESASVTTLEHAIHTQILQIQYYQPRFSSLTSGQSVSLHRLQEILGDSHFIQYFVNHQQYHALLINRNGIYKHLVLADIQTISQLRKAFLATIERMLALATKMTSTRLLQRLPALLSDTQQHLQRLWQTLFLPIQAHLPSHGQLILSPDSELHSLPFHAFFDGKGYLAERYSMSYVPSATILDYCAQQSIRGNGVLLCGYDDGRLNAVSKELHSLVHLFPNALLTLGKDSTSATFLTRAPLQQIIHLSTHAAFRQDRPMLSSIALADRHLTLAEVARLNLCADLVGLSGCETGTGECIGTELLSLSSGFLGAGARTLLASLWRVEDESTAQLIESFYQAANAGLNLSDALRSAQQSMLQKARKATDGSTIFQHPAFWASFSLIGDGISSEPFARKP